MSDIFDDYQPGLESPASHAVAVSPDDGTDLARVSRALNVAEGGAVRVTTLGGEDATVFIAAGITFPLRVSRVWATGTTATGIVALC